MAAAPGWCPRCWRDAQWCECTAESMRTPPTSEPAKTNKPARKVVGTSVLYTRALTGPEVVQQLQDQCPVCHHEGLEERLPNICSCPECGGTFVTLVNYEG